MNPRQSRGFDESPVFCRLLVVRHNQKLVQNCQNNLNHNCRLLVSNLLLTTKVAPDDVPYH